MLCLNTLKTYSKYHSVLTLFLCLWSGSSLAQEQRFTFLRSVPCPTPMAVAADLHGNIYIKSTKGIISKYNAEGEITGVFSSPKGLKPTSFELYQGLNLLVFYQTTQEYLYLDQNYMPSQLFPLNLAAQDYAFAITQSAGPVLWLSDVSHQKFIKYDMNSQQKVTELFFEDFEPEQTLQIRKLVTYQNRIYINTWQSGIYVLDSFGNFIKHLPVRTSGLHFKDDYLYYLDGKKIKFEHLYTSHHKHIQSPDESIYTDILITDKYYLLFTEQQFDIYKMKKEQ